MASQRSTLKQLFQRYRRPGNLAFATLFLLLSLALASQLGSQVSWAKSTKWSSQPALWPTISVIGMTVFAAFNWLSAVLSPRIAGRWREVAVWLRSLEFAAWFMVYVWTVPLMGYLPATVLFAVVLSLRMGYRQPKMLLYAALTGILIVVLFKTMLQVKVPGGQLYEHLPDDLRSFMLTYF